MDPLLLGAIAVAFLLGWLFARSRRLSKKLSKEELEERDEFVRDAMKHEP